MRLAPLPVNLFFWPRAGYWYWIPKDQSLKVSAHRNNFQIINDILTLEPPLNVVFNIFSAISVLDEADRILDLGFAHTMNAIIENLPTQRQTLLYSATQTKWDYFDIHSGAASE